MQCSIFAFYLSYLDIFGIPVALSFALQKSSRTAFGGACTIVFLALAVWSVLHAGQDLVHKQDPSVLQYVTYSEEPEEIIISPDTFPLAFGLQRPPALSYEL